MMNFIRIIYFPFRFIKAVYYKTILGSYGWRSVIMNPLKIDGKCNVYVGNRVIIEYKTWLAAKPLTGRKVRLEIGDGCAIGHFNHIYATHSVILHKNVLTADKVYISDNLHGYQDIGEPILKQSIIQKGSVEIGEGSWLGENVCVIGAKIGKHCVIGANSFINKDVPDYSIVAGTPAKIIGKVIINDEGEANFEYFQ